MIVTAPGEENEVRALFSVRPLDGLDVAIVLRQTDDVPLPSPVERDRPWGTAHALWSARETVTGSFLLFNADDYYGTNAPTTLAAALPDAAEHPVFVLLAYPLSSTLSPVGSVSRAVCDTDGLGRLTGLREYTAIDCDGHVASGPNAGRALPLDARVSMNAWAFTPAVFPVLDGFLREFLVTADLQRDECYLSTAIGAAVQAGEIEVRVMPAPDRWCGMTWPGDRDRVAHCIAEQTAPHRAAEGFGLDLLNESPIPFG